MAIPEGNTVRERTRREQIDQALLTAVRLAQSNNQAVKRLRVILIGAPPEGQVLQERPARVGWVGEIEDGLETIIDHLADTAKVLEEVSQQLATQPPTAASENSGSLRSGSLRV